MSNDTQQNKGLEDQIPAMGGRILVEVLRDGPNGPVVIQRSEASNLIVNSGKKQVWRKVMGINTRLFKWFRLGKNSAAATSGGTNVKSALASASLKTASSMTVDAGRTFKWVVSYPSGALSLSAAALKEVVLMDSISTPGGSILMRCVFATVSKTTADKLKITYKARIT